MRRERERNVSTKNVLSSLLDYNLRRRRKNRALCSILCWCPFNTTNQRTDWTSTVLQRDLIHLHLPSIKSFIVDEPIETVVCAPLLPIGPHCHSPNANEGRTNSFLDNYVKQIRVQPVSTGSLPEKRERKRHDRSIVGQRAILIRVGLRSIRRDQQDRLSLDSWTAESNMPTALVANNYA